MRGVVPLHSSTSYCISRRLIPLAGIRNLIPISRLLGVPGHFYLLSVLFTSTGRQGRIMYLCHWWPFLVCICQSACSALLLLPSLVENYTTTGQLDIVLWRWPICLPNKACLSTKKLYCALLETCFLVILLSLITQLLLWLILANCDQIVILYSYMHCSVLGMWKGKLHSSHQITISVATITL